MDRHDFRAVCQGLVDTVLIWFDDGVEYEDEEGGYLYCDICEGSNEEDRSEDVIHNKDCPVVIAEKFLKEF